MEHRTRKLVMPRDLNSSNTLFGGQTLAWLDEEAAIFVRCQTGHKRIVTARFGEANFKSPARADDVLEIGCELVKVGSSSITVRAELRNKDTRELIVAIEEIVFVCLDDTDRPVRIPDQAPCRVSQAEACIKLLRVLR
jgi:acyl-CoA thioesterase YciA